MIKIIKIAVIYMKETKNIMGQTRNMKFNITYELSLSGNNHNEPTISDSGDNYYLITPDTLRKKI